MKWWRPEAAESGFTRGWSRESGSGGRRWPLEDVGCKGGKEMECDFAGKVGSQKGFLERWLNCQLACVRVEMLQQVDGGESCRNSLSGREETEAQRGYNLPKITQRGSDGPGSEPCSLHSTTCAAESTPAPGAPPPKYRDAKVTFFLHSIHIRGSPAPGLGVAGQPLWPRQRLRPRPKY